MKLQTKYFGELEIQEWEIVEFPLGIPGFNEHKQFVILPFENSFFYILQSTKEAEIAFIIADPFTFFPDYEFILEKEEQEKLQVQKAEDIAVFVILTVESNIQNTTANLKAPVVINHNKKIGKQIILNKTEYKTKERIYKVISSIGQEG
ncbi:flagellar assembly protein FliW [Peribacillus tepidiphilus]|uniref:flagellar assembly protein FliW n=1 Tax=Peribacillus tepidiphilus TaxID=2652445 RepID=UPI0012912B61|nr:flagellar assembly protein FliW [Peribacillus tepidiphilus]